MTSYMMFMMIRHVYVCLWVAGPVAPPHAAIICQRAMADRIKFCYFDFLEVDIWFWGPISNIFGVGFNQKTV